jgi:competence protein ComGC
MMMIIIIIIIIIIINLTANALSPGGSGYNACTKVLIKELRNLSREGYMRSMQ